MNNYCVSMENALQKLFSRICASAVRSWNVYTWKIVIVMDKVNFYGLCGTPEGTDVENVGGSEEIIFLSDISSSST